MVQKLGRGKTREGWVVHQFYIHTVDGSEILHHLGCLKPCKYRDVYHILPYQLVNAGFQPSTPLETFFFQVIWSHQTRRKHNNFKHHRIHEKMACLPTWVIPYHKKSTIYKMQANIQVPWILWPMGTKHRSKYVWRNHSTLYPLVALAPGDSEFLLANCSDYNHGNLRVPPVCHPPQEIRPY